MAQFLMGIDNGSTVTKAAIFDPEGNEIGSFGTLLETSMPKPGYYERDPEAIWQSNIQAIRGVIEETGVEPGDIAAVSLTGYGECVNLVDENGKPVYTSVQGTDTRAAALLHEWQKNGIADSLQELTYLVPYPASSSLLLAWMKQQEPAELKKARWWFTIKDYIRFRLTGNPTQEITSHANCGFMNLRDPGGDDLLFEMQGIMDCKRLIPPVIKPTDIAGTIGRETALLTKLKEGTPVVAGCYDICASGLACGLTDETRAAIIVGTWCNNEIVSREPIVSKDILATCHYVKEGYWLTCDGSPTSASNLEWFVKEFLQEERKIAAANGTSVYDVCNRSVKETAPLDTEIVFLPLLYGGYGPSPAAAAFLGIEGWHRRAHVIRAIYEGICFSHKRHFASVMRHGNIKPSAARICGGGTRSDEWTQMFADVFQLPMEVIHASEPGALGSCICAAVGIGLYADFDEAVRRMVRVKKTVMPDPAMKKVYESKYDKFNKALKALEAY